jgi:nucleoside-diphosphate-sugar epimerase
MLRNSAVVLGSSGFIGTRLCKYLASRDVRVQAAIDLNDPREVISGVQFHKGDVRSPIPVEWGVGADILYNFAAVHRTPGHPEGEYYETNLQGAINAVNFADACDIKTIVFTSSISVYGPSEEVITEQSPLKPISAYGRSKGIAESIHRQWLRQGGGRRLVIVRPGVVFGPGEKGNYTNLAKALKGGYFFYPGRDDAVKSGGYVDELLLAIDYALSQNSDYTLFNFAFPEMNTTKDIVSAMGRVRGTQFRPPLLPLPLLMLGAGAFEILSKLGLKTPIHRERVMKLVSSTKIRPLWLEENHYPYKYNLESALKHWMDEGKGNFE